MSMAEPMSPRARNSVPVTLSDRAYQDFEYAAEEKGIPLATFLRNILETHHETPSFGAFLRRLRNGTSIKEAIASLQAAAEGKGLTAEEAGVLLKALRASVRKEEDA